MGSQFSDPRMNDAILWGGTGQARVVRPILESTGMRVIRLFDNNQKLRSPFADVPFGGGWTEFLRWRAEITTHVAFVVCIGGEQGRDRAAISEQLVAQGLRPVNIIHDRAWVADSARLGTGSQILAAAAVCENVELGNFCIVNTAASVDHDCRLGSGVHVMPGATIAGEVLIGDFVSIGANATILPRLQIGVGATVGAGAVVTRDVAAGDTVIGVPARRFARSRLPRQ